MGCFFLILKSGIKKKKNWGLCLKLKFSCYRPEMWNKIIDSCGVEFSEL
jgi:hypothetical protein